MRYLCLATCRQSHTIRGEALPDKSKEILFNWIFKLIQRVKKRQYNNDIRIIQIDNERGMFATATVQLLKDEGIELITSSPRTSYQNGKAEHIGQVIMNKMKPMHIDSGIPPEL